jgi:hypothetical protein
MDDLCTPADWFLMISLGSLCLSGAFMFLAMGIAIIMDRF